MSFPFKRWLGILLFGAYALYVWREMTAGHGSEHDDEHLEPLKFRPKARIRIWPGLLCKHSPRFS